MRANSHLVTHGHARANATSRTYNIWMNMRQRCLNKLHRDWPRYGGRGITVTKKWNDFGRFLLDMGEAPDGLSLDRKNNDGGYCKRNCRWATRRDQNLNKRTTAYITYKGQKKPLMVWAEIVGVPHQLVRDRLKLGWSTQDALLKPTRKITRRGNHEICSHAGQGI